MGIKVYVEDHESLRHALREFQRLTRGINRRRHGRVPTNYYIKPSQLRRWRKGNAKLKAFRIQFLTGGLTPKKE